MHSIPHGLRRRYGAAAVVQAVALAALPATAAVAQTCPALKLPLPTGLLWRDRAAELRRLARWHRHADSVVWRMTSRGVLLCSGTLPVNRVTRYRLRLIPTVWSTYGGLIAAAAHANNVPAELIVTIIVNESGGQAHAIHKYAGFVSDARTPSRISIGLGQMLLSTARAIMKDRSIDRAWLSRPRNAIRAIAVYLDRQYRMTGFDPPLVAAAYNAGALYRDPSPANRWRLRNHPLGGSTYIDAFVAIANGAVMHLKRTGRPPAQSFAAVLAGIGPRPRLRPGCGARCRR
jgi:soluble lytic murein transglycosylase-like protein